MSFPCLCHLKPEDYEHVYEPQDDTYLLCDALSACLPKLVVPAYPLCLEMGSGSGAVSAHTATVLRQCGRVPFLWAVDINPAACAATRGTAVTNVLQDDIDVVNGDYTTASLVRWAGLVDVLLFNPPYVPTPSEEIKWGGIAAAWAGGEDGREVIDAVLPRIPGLLAKPHGACFMVLVEDNKPKDVCKILAGSGLVGTKALSRKAHNEQLHIYKFTWRAIEGTPGSASAAKS